MNNDIMKVLQEKGVTEEELRDVFNTMYNNTLRAMFQQQEELNNRVGMSPDDIRELIEIASEKEDSADRDLARGELNVTLTWYLQEYISALTHEAEELRDHLHWKWWKDYGEDININQVKVEIVDIMHFLISLALPLMDADEFVDLYFRKMNLNHHRQDVGYDDNYQKVDAEGVEDNEALFKEESEDGQRSEN